MEPTCRLFIASLGSGLLPRLWKMAYVIPISKVQPPERRSTRAQFIDLSKAFDRVDYSTVTNKLASLGMHPSLRKWLHSSCKVGSNASKLDLPFRNGLAWMAVCHRALGWAHTFSSFILMTCKPPLPPSSSLTTLQLLKFSFSIIIALNKR